MCHEVGLVCALVVLVVVPAQKYGGGVYKAKKRAKLFPLMPDPSSDGPVLTPVGVE